MVVEAEAPEAPISLKRGSLDVAIGDLGTYLHLLTCPYTVSCTYNLGEIVRILYIYSQFISISYKWVDTASLPQ